MEQLEIYGKSNLKILDLYLEIYEEFLWKLATEISEKDTNWSKKIAAYDRQYIKNNSSRMLISKDYYEKKDFQPTVDDMDLAGLLKYFEFYDRHNTKVMQNEYKVTGNFYKKLWAIREDRNKARGHITKRMLIQYSDENLFDALKEIVGLFDASKVAFGAPYKKRANQFIQEVVQYKKYKPLSISEIADENLVTPKFIEKVLIDEGISYRNNEIYGKSFEEIKEKLYPVIIAKREDEYKLQKINAGKIAPVDITLSQAKKGRLSRQELLSVFAHYEVVWDYSALISKYFSDFAIGTMEGVLTDVGRYVSIDSEVKNHLLQVTKINIEGIDYSDAYGRSFIEKRENARKAFKVFARLTQKKCLRERFLSNREEIDSELLIYLAKNINEKYKLCIITQDQQTANALWKLGRENVVVCRLVNGEALEIFPEGEVAQEVLPQEVVEQENLLVDKNAIIPVQMAPMEGTLLKSQKYGDIKLIEKISEGGEGAVFSTPYPQQVAKIFHTDKNTVRRKEKIEQMLSIQMENEYICWPKDALYTYSGEFVGFLMPAARGKDMSNTVCRTGRGVVRGFADWKRRDLVLTAINVVKLFSDLHKKDILMGDVNPRNIMLEAPDKVYFVDTDSYQISKDYLCTVGVPLFTSPRIHGQLQKNKADYSKIVRQTMDERYAMSVLVFMILFTGQPPFGMDGSEGLVDNILKGNFPYRYKEETKDDVPSGVWRFIWSHLPYELKTLFYDAFVQQKYAQEQKWIQVLERYLDSIDSGKSTNEVYPRTFKEAVSDFVTLQCRECGKTFNMAKDIYEKRNSEGKPADCCPECRDFFALNSEIEVNVKCSVCGKTFAMSRLKAAIELEEKGRNPICPECLTENKGAFGKTKGLYDAANWDRGEYDKTLAQLEAEFGLDCSDIMQLPFEELLQRARQGEAVCQYVLAKKFFNGEAMPELERLAQAGDEDAKALCLHMIEHKYNNVSIGAESMRAAANNGIMVAALLYAEVYGFYWNAYSEAVDYLEMVAATGHKGAKSTLAMFYFEMGENREAENQLEDLVRQDIPEAYYNKYLIADALGIPNPTAALEKAVESGLRIAHKEKIRKSLHTVTINDMALNEIKAMLSKNPQSEFLQFLFGMEVYQYYMGTGKVVPEDVDRGFQYLAEQAERKRGLSCYYLAQYYLRGIGNIPKDSQRGEYYLERAEQYLPGEYRRIMNSEMKVHEKYLSKLEQETLEYQMYHTHFVNNIRDVWMQNPEIYKEQIREKQKAYETPMQVHEPVEKKQEKAKTNTNTNTNVQERSAAKDVKKKPTYWKSIGRMLLIILILAIIALIVLWAKANWETVEFIAAMALVIGFIGFCMKR